MANGTTRARSRYGGFLVFFHGFMLLLIVAAYCTMEFKSVYPKGRPVARGACDLALHDWSDGVCTSLAIAGYFIVGAHAAAALYHHYLRRDNTLRLMWRGG